MTLRFCFLLFCSTFVSLAITAERSFAESIDVAEGKVVKMVPSKKEIYVRTESGKNEYYFNDKTAVEANGVEKKYSDLAEGMKVKVTANKIGKRLDPVKVEIVTE